MGRLQRANPLAPPLGGYLSALFFKKEGQNNQLSPNKGEGENPLPLYEPNRASLRSQTGVTYDRRLRIVRTHWT